MKLKNLVFLVFFLLIFSYAYADDRIIILNYKNIQPQTLEKIKVSTTDSNLSEIVDDKNRKKIYLSIKDTINPNDIKLVFNFSWKVLNYTYNYIPKFKKNFDISSKIKYKRIQEKPLSCELSVTADILTYLTWKKVSEEDVLTKIENKYLNVLPYQFDWKMYWGNPNLWFVWFMDYYWEKSSVKPTQRDMTWYWVYEKPISKVYEAYWFSGEIISKDNYTKDFDRKKHLSYLLKNLERWNMIQLWADWCTREEFDDWTISKYDISQEKVDNKVYAKNYCTTTLEDRKIDWYYLEDFKEKKVSWLIWEHAFYLLWYEWWVENPTKIIVWDSDTWYHKYDTEEWMRKWSLMDYKSIIIKKN